MKRALYHELAGWKKSPRRKPLLLRGARQTGKTHLLREFGRKEYGRFVYCNFEEDPALDSFFQRDLNPNRILKELSIYKGVEIQPGGDLVIFDEIQASGKALNSLKYFQEEAGDYHIAAAGSLLGIRMSLSGSFPVGKVKFLDLYPMSFLEFLAASDKPQYGSLITELETSTPLPEAIHLDLLGYLRRYYFTGGMPEAVRHFLDSGNPEETRTIQKDILESYMLDFAKHAPSTDIPKLSLIWESIPRHLARENKKFIFSAVKAGARARSYENALRWLRDAGLILLCHAVTTSKIPLNHFADRNCFKVYALDIGLLGAMAGTPVGLMVKGDRLFNEYEGALAENYVAQELVAGHHSKLFYWRSRGGKAELDFLCEFEDCVAPLEVKAGRSRRSRSLRSFDDQFSPRTLFRTNLLNLKRDGKICNLPLYAVSQLSRFL